MTNYISLPYIQSFINRYTKEIMIAVGIIGLGVASTFGYWMYRSHQEEAAQIAFVTCIEEFNNAQHNPASWPTVALAAVTGYRQHSGSSLAPYFLALEVQSLIGQGKLSEAINSLDRVVGMIPKSSPLYFTYAIQAARMKLDSDDESLKNNGLRDLEALATNVKNKNRDQASYYLAEYLASHGSVDRAQELFNQLVVAFPEGGLASSPWAVLAQEKLKEYAA